MKRLALLGALTAALAAAGPATAADGQSATGSLGTVQVGGLNASPATAVSAPATVNAPVTVASRGGSSSSSTSSTGAAATTSSGGPASSGSQSAQRSIGTVQVGSVNVAPSTTADAPVNANAPVTVASSGGSGSGSSTSTSGGASAASNGSSGAAGAGQSASKSAATVQVGSANLAPSTAVNAPVNANAPVSVLSENGGGSASTATGGTSAQSGNDKGDGASNQSAQRSIGTVQVGSVGVTPGTAVNAPVNANAPVSVLSENGGTGNAGSNTGGATASGSGNDGSDGSTGADQSASRSVGTVQVGSADVAPATALNAPANANAPVSVLSDGGGSGPTGSSGGASASNGGGGGGSAPGQSADHSAGTVQVGSANVAPSTAVNAPVQLSAPAEVGSAGCANCGGSCGGSCNAPPAEAGDGCGCDALGDVTERLRVGLHKLVWGTRRATGCATGTLRGALALMAKAGATLNARVDHTSATLKAGVAKTTAALHGTAGDCAGLALKLLAGTPSLAASAKAGLEAKARAVGDTAASAAAKTAARVTATLPAVKAEGALAGGAALAPATPDGVCL